MRTLGRSSTSCCLANTSSFAGKTQQRSIEAGAASRPIVGAAPVCVAFLLHAGPSPHPRGSQTAAQTRRGGWQRWSGSPSVARVRLEDRRVDEVAVVGDEDKAGKGHVHAVAGIAITGRPQRPPSSSCTASRCWRPAAVRSAIRTRAGAECSAACATALTPSSANSSTAVISSEPGHVIGGTCAIARLAQSADTEFASVVVYCHAVHRP
jgi:hypothetical protein